MTWGPPGSQPGDYGPPQDQPGYSPPPQQPAYSPPPPAYSPPPQQQGYGYGQPEQYGSTPSTAGGLSAMSPLDLVTAAAGLLAFIFSMLSFYTGKVTFAGQSRTAHENAWHGFFGWFGVLLALAGTVVLVVTLLAPTVRLPLPARLTVLGAFVLALIFEIIAIFVTPNKASSVPSEFKVSYGRGYGFWLTLIFVAIGTGLAAYRFQQTGGSFGNLLGDRAAAGSAEQPNQQGFAQQPGYQAPQQQVYQPPQQQAYQPPQPPQPPQQGYQPPAYQQPPAQQPPAQQPPPAYQPPPAAPGYAPPPPPPPPPPAQPEPRRDDGGQG